MKVYKFGIIFLAGVLGICNPQAVSADNSYPEYVHQQCPIPLTEVGKGTYRRFGFSIYEATLWAASDIWDARRPYLLELHYTRDISKDTLVDSVIDDIKDQGTADDETLIRWRKTFDYIFPEINSGDVMSGLCVPDKKTQLFFNGQKLAEIDDGLMSKAFFNIWFGEKADQDLRKSLLNRSTNQ